LASPSDLREERETLAHLIREINDVLVFLAPEKGLFLEPIRYETHVFPDLGSPQDVINREIPLDYDILIGVMWRRCGTPTQNYPSGTIEEFWRAYERRKTAGRPTIMFYFCEEPIPVPNGEELKQLQDLAAFKEQVVKLGLTGSFQRRADFREHVRGDLLRAVKTLLESTGRPAPEQPTQVLRSSEVQSEIRNEYFELASEYDRLRREMKPGASRTRRMSALFNEMTAKAAPARPLLLEITQSVSAEARLGAVAILTVFPSSQISRLVGGTPGS